MPIADAASNPHHDERIMGEAIPAVHPSCSCFVPRPSSTRTQRPLPSYSGPRIPEAIGERLRSLQGVYEGLKARQVPCALHGNAVLSVAAIASP